MPMNRGWRSNPPGVHSLKPTWATIAGVTPWTSDPVGATPPNGGVRRSICFSAEWIVRRVRRS
jgi:hypothetical protein